VLDTLALELRSDSIESRVVGYSGEEAVSSSLCPYSPNVADSLRAQRERANERKGGAGREWPRISESGKPVEKTEGVKVLTMDEGEVVLAVGSGRYEFAGKVAR
jgi:hypothetical protein